MTIEKCKKLLSDAGLFYWTADEIDEDDDPDMLQTLNMNDTWAWAAAFGQYVPDDKIKEVADLFQTYGFCGVLYWVSEQNNQMESEFSHVNRMVQFVRTEEALRKSVDSRSQYAYLKRTYTLSA